MAEISCWRLLFRPPMFQHLRIALNSEPLDQFEWITARWKAFILLFSNIMRFTFFRVIFLLRSADFHWFHKKYVMWHHSTIFNPIWCFWYTYRPPMGYQNVAKKAKKSGVNHVQGISYSKVKGKCLRQQKMDINNAIIFWYFEKTTQ